MGRLSQAFANFWRGLVSAFIKDVAVSNPEIAYAGILEQQKRDLDRLIKAAGPILGERNKCERELAQVRDELKKKRAAVQVTLKTRNKSAGSVLLQQVQAMEAQEAGLVTDFETFSAQSKRIQSDIAHVRGQILANKQKFRINVGRLRNAQARRRLLQTMDELSVDGADQMIQAIDDHVEATIGEVQIREEMDDATNLDRQVREAERAAAPLAAEMEFDRMLAEMESSQGTHSASPPPGKNGGKQV